MIVCEHIETNGDFICIKCGYKVFEVETRECKDCSFFKDMGFMEIPICRKYLMGVSRDMHVVYKEKDGTCFNEAKPHLDALNEIWKRG